MTDAEIMKEGLKVLGDKATLEKLNAWCQAKRDLLAIEDGEDAPEEKAAKDAEKADSGAPEAPEEPAKASVDAEDAAALSATPEAEDVVVEASVDAPAVEAADPSDGAGEDALAGEAMSAIGLLSEATGMDPASVVASLRDMAAQVAAVLSGQPDSGAPAEQPAMSRDVTVAASKARLEATEAKLSAVVRDSAVKVAALEKQVAQLSAGSNERRIDDAIRAGHILPAHKAIFVALAKADHAEFESQLKGAEGAPAVVVADIATGKGSGPTKDNVTPQGDDPKLALLAATLRNAGMPEHVIAAAVKREAAKDFAGRA